MQVLNAAENTSVTWLRKLSIC